MYLEASTREIEAIHRTGFKFQSPYHHSIRFGDILTAFYKTSNSISFNDKMIYQLIKLPF